jgi:rSAM/selenodomain-associated transferase 2
MLSIIIPALNEEKNIGKTLASIGRCSDGEIIVIDGGSSDGTVQIARSFKAAVFISQPPRAVQMNKGARAAKGDILLFVHADTTLPLGFFDRIQTTLSKKGVVAGAFELGVDHPGKWARLVEKTANWRSRYLQLPYGDQAIFVKKNTFQKYGGFDNVELLEDLMFIRRLRKYGKIAVARDRVVTSGRRWKRLGVFKTTLINQVILAGYLLGFSTPFLKKLYGIGQKR